MLIRKWLMLTVNAYDSNPDDDRDATKFEYR